MAGNTSAPGATVASRTLALLGAYDGDHRSLTLTQLARRAGLPAATAHRLVADLAAWGALERRPSGHYVIGQRLWDIGLLAPTPTGLREIASPFLHDLYGATLATVHLAVRDGTSVLYLDRLSGHASVPVVSSVGSRLPLHATAVGKMLLAWAPAEVQADALTRLTSITPHTVTDRREMVEQLRRVRRDGFAQTREEMSPGASSVAVAITGDDQRPIAALGIVVASLERNLGRLVAALQVGAQGIRRSLLGSPLP